MNMIFNRSSLISLAGAALLLGGCASVDDVKHAQATADQAMSTAQHAQATADQALSAAQAAQQGVDQERSQMTQWEQMHHRGERD